MSSAKAKKNLKPQAEAERQVWKILKKMEELGIDKSHLKNVMPKNKNKNAKILKPKFLSLAILVLLILIWFLCGSYFGKSDCWIPMPDFIQAASRPPVDCKMCRDITDIRRMSNLTREEFEKKYAYSGTPIIVTDAMVNWTAHKIFDFNFFKELYTKGQEGKAFDRCSFFPYKTEFKSLEEALEMEEERSRLEKGTKSWYIGWSNCQESTAKILRKHYTKPYFLPESSDNLVLDWIFMGGPGDGAHMHVDNVVYPSWQAQLKGKKEWDLAPPPECFYECMAFTAVVNPGEVIVLDTNRWFHRTRVISEDISITIGAEYD